jgi:iron complex transport system substrate-binding protein
MPTLADIWADLLHTDPRLVPDLRRRIAETSARANGWGRRPAIGCLRGIDPLTAAGDWLPELVELAGGVNLFGVPGRPDALLAFDDLRREDPDVILVMLRGLDLGQARGSLSALTSRPEWPRLKAVRNGRVLLADGDLFDHPGPRLAEVLEILAEAIQPAAFCFGHEGMFAI